LKNNRKLSFILSFVICLAIVGIFPTMVEAAWSRDQYYEDTMTARDQFDFSDPQFLPDEEFFGVWDEENGDWKEGYVPYFYYEMYPELSKVEEAAKQGDYETCKEEILAYYREKSSNYKMGYTSGVLTDLNRAKAELAITCTGDSSWGRTHFTTKAGWHSIPLDYIVSNRLGLGKKTQIYALCTTTKDGYRVEIDRTEDYMPYMEVVVNGEKKIYKATRTTYVDGNITDAKDLDPDKLLIEESVTSIGKLYPRDENTKRSFVQFDFDNITEEEAKFITSANLYLYGKVTEDDIDDAPLFERDYKMVHAFEWEYDAQIDPAFTYEKMNSYTELLRCVDGEGGHRRFPNYYNGTSVASETAAPSIGNLAEAYTTTGDEFFAWHAIKTLSAIAIYYGSFEHTDNLAPSLHGLTAASWGYGTVWAIDRLINSQHMTPDAFTLILKATHIRGHWLEKNWIGSYESVNWGGYGVQGIMAISMFYPEFRAAHGDLWRNEDGSLYLEFPDRGGSVRGGWLEVANYRNSYKVGANMHDDGASFEAPIGYSFESLGAYLTPKQYGEKLNYDYSSFYTPKVEDESDYIYVGKERMKRTLRYLATISTPMGGHFQVGDGGGWNDNALSSFKNGYLEFIQDDVIDYIISKGEEGTKPDFTTITYEGDIPEGEVGRGGKVAVFRNAWDESAIAMMFQAWGKANHSHQDD